MIDAGSANTSCALGSISRAVIRVRVPVCVCACGFRQILCTQAKVHFHEHVGIQTHRDDNSLPSLHKTRSGLCVRAGEESGMADGSKGISRGSCVERW